MAAQVDSYSAPWLSSYMVQGMEDQPQKYSYLWSSYITVKLLLQQCMGP